MMPKWLSRLLSFAVVIAVWTFLITDFLRKDAGVKIGVAAFAAAVVLVAVLSIRYRAVDRAVKAGLGYYMRACAGLAAVTVPTSIAMVVLRLTVERMPVALQVAVFLLVGAGLAWAVYQIATAARREAMFRRLGRTGALAPFAYSLNVLLISMVFYASGSYALASHGRLHYLPPPGGTITVGGLQDFYLWHFLRAVPLLDVTETLRWRQPLAYESGSAGLILLLFKLTVIIPVISAFTGYWAFRQAKPDGPAPASAPAEAVVGEAAARRS